MATAVVSKRNVQGFVILFISVLLLLSSIYCGLSALSHSSLEKGVAHLQLSHDKSPAFNLPHDLAESFAAELGARDLTVNHSSSYAHFTVRGGQVKRARPVDFESEFQAAKDQGVVALAEIEAAFSGTCKRAPAKDFKPEDLNNGWSRTDGRTKGYPASWDTAFQKLLGRANVPTEQQSLYTVLYQDKTFTNAEGGGQVAVRTGPSKEADDSMLMARQAFQDQAYYKQYYFPSISAILASDINSPANQVRKRFRAMRQNPPSSQAINDKWVPTLNRWSDVTWTVWKQLAKDDYKKLRYIAHDNTANLQTEHVMENIFTKEARKNAAGSGSGSSSGSGSDSGSSSGSSSGSGSSGSSSSDGEDEPGFPGLSYGMDSDEGKALLGTPNGIGTARILDRAAELGRRELKVYVFAREDGKYCMLWDMHPPGRPSMPDQHKGKKHRLRGHHFFRHRL
ncbi:MAG: hypothetical protein LQ346_008507 [Caloplaca aetnensis]|nr:MAG: hypothetical protein LQ346_008507 [Caloplaca aetnensis]